MFTITVDVVDVILRTLVYVNRSLFGYVVCGTVLRDGWLES